MTRSALPAELIDSLQKVPGFRESSFLAVHEAGDQVTSVRINTKKFAGDVQLHFPGATPVPWSSSGYYLPARPAFIFDPWLHAGAYYVQEASGMFLEYCLRHTLDLTRPLRVLDLCAAPGGKSTVIQSLLSPESLLVSNEVIKTRVNILEENLVKWGGANKIVTSNDPRDFERLDSYFDVIVVDAPCSGSGLFRRDPDAVKEWSLDAVGLCCQRQRRILTEALPALKKGGTLIYSTCSYSAEENEDICDWLGDEFDLLPLPLKLNNEWNITEAISRKNNIPGYRFFPDQVRGEGFFIACFRKNDAGEEEPAGRMQKFQRLSALEYRIVNEWLEPGHDLALFHLAEEIFAFPATMTSDLSILAGSLYLRNAGISCGRIVHDSLIPAHALALARVLRNETLSVEVDLHQALDYLRKQEPSFVTKDKGWQLVRYESMNLGWIKSLGNRSNNYYPKEWRILKSINS